MSDKEIDDIFTLTDDDLSNLPEAMAEAFKIRVRTTRASYILDNRIVDLIKIADRPLSVNELMIGLYKKYDHDVTDRKPFNSRLHRMIKRGQISSVAGTRGLFSLPLKSE